MKQFSLILISLAAAFARPPGFSTANADGDKPAPVDPAIQKQLDDQAAQIAELQKQLAVRNAEPAPEDETTLGLLCKGAGVELKDVRWRVQAGLDPEQAVQAALAQASADKAAAKREREEAKARK